MEQHTRVANSIKPIENDSVIQDVFNVVIELRVNADRLEGVLRKLREDDNDRH